MSLNLIGQLVRAKIAEDAWIADTRLRGEKVKLYREMVDGDHPSNMTREMRKLLNIKAVEGQGEFNDNYMDIVVQTMTDRLTLTAITGIPPQDTNKKSPEGEAVKDPVSEWAKTVLDFNRLDAMQGDVHEGTIRDGDSFVMASFDNEKKLPKFTHELAYDGTSGIVPVYTSADIAEMDCCLKVWHITSAGGKLNDTMRVNVYYPDRIQKWVSPDGNQLEPFTDPDTDKDGNLKWTMDDGKPIGIPIIHFRNRGRQNYGLSELGNAIPLQHVINRFLHSFVMAAELTAFRIFIAKGFVPPPALTPGMIIEILNNGGPLTKDDIADFTAIDGDNLVQYIDSLKWVSQEIGRVTRTPAPELMGADDSSGEALKQREIGLLGKVKRFQIKGGNSWEDVFGVAHRIQAVFGDKKPPAYERFYAQWKDAEIRNDKVTIEGALLLRPLIGDKETMRIVAPIYGWDEDRITEILDDAAEQKEAAMEAAMSAMPNFGANGRNGTGRPPANGQPQIPGQQVARAGA